MKKIAIFLSMLALSAFSGILAIFILFINQYNEDDPIIEYRNILFIVADDLGIFENYF